MSALGPQRLDAFLAALADRTPTPGGGAVAAVTMSIAAAQAEMVVRYSEGKPALAEHADLHADALAALARLRGDALALADDDVAAYGRLNALWKLPKDAPERAAAMPEAVRGAIAPPRRMVASALDVLERVDTLCGRTSRMLRSDLAIAAIVAEAAARAAAWNVRINLPLLDDAAEADAHDVAVEDELRRAADLTRRIEAACAG